MKSRGLSTPVKRKHEVLQIVFDLGEKKQETLHVYEDSDITTIAKQFVNKHQLKDEATSLIEQTIINNLQESNVSKQSIFDRLHNEAAVKAQRRHQQFITTALSQTSTIEKKHITHYPEQKLYEKQLQSRLIEPKQEPDYPFKPNINEKSLSLAKRPSMPIPDYLIMEGKQMSQRKEKMRISRLAEINEQCSFQPQINVISSKINQEKLRNYSSDSKLKIHERLYHEGLNSMKKKKESSEILTQSKISSKKREPSDIPFLDRMQISIQKRKQRFEDTSQTEISSYDSKTGQKFHQPLIGRPPLINRNSENLPIGEYLYQMRTVAEDYQNYLMEQQKQQTLSQMVKSSERSNLIFEQKKRKLLEEIFFILDSDGDGQISASSIEISGIQSEILQILAPLLCEMESIQAQLNLESFVDAADRLISQLTIDERNKLLNGLKPLKTLDLEQCTFQPQLCKNSMKIVKSVSKSQHKKVEDIKQQQEQKMMEECTFKPQLYAPLKIYDFMLNE